MECDRNTYDITYGTLTANWRRQQRSGLNVPRPSPPEQLIHPASRQTVLSHPEIFKIVTPVKVEVFEDLLLDHPNQPFVKSVCDGLRYGFWPWADLWKADYPETLDSSQSEHDASREKFLSDQRDVEVAAGRYSPSIGTSAVLGPNRPGQAGPK